MLSEALVTSFSVHTAQNFAMKRPSFLGLKKSGFLRGVQKWSFCGGSTGIKGGSVKETPFLPAVVFLLSNWYLGTVVPVHVAMHR
jgi:hypothetical protein